MTRADLRCWICGGDHFELEREANFSGELEPNSFAITDAHYGATGELWRCSGCGFLQCGDIEEVVGYYEDLEDREYDEGREERSLQMRKLLERIRRIRPNGSLLDVGAGSGMLIEQAREMGYDAVGIEPSRWLQRVACDRGLSVVQGTLPHPEVSGPFDIVTVIDVIEHVSGPVELLEEVRRVLHPDGLIAIVTPDLGSMAARLMGWKWWHFRVAHIGYFDRKTLTLAIERAGFSTCELIRPSWYFRADYLWKRLNSYLPKALALPEFRFLRRFTIPLNLGDSFLALCAPQQSKGDDESLRRNRSA
jgi:SAM-dependent methyltransferase